MNFVRSNIPLGCKHLGNRKIEFETCVQFILTIHFRSNFFDYRLNNEENVN